MNFRGAVSIFLSSIVAFILLGVITSMTMSGGKTSTRTKTSDNEVKTITTGNLLRTEDKSLSKTNYKLSSISLNERVIHIYGEINEMTAPPVALQILKLGSSSEPMYILIDSPGGSVLSGAQLISAMQAAKGPVNTVCVGICASMAAMIHQFGTNRLVLDRSFLMFHPASGGAEGEVDKMFSRLSTIRRFIGKMEMNAAVRSGISYEEYKKLSGVELWLDAEDAYNSKFADKVVFIRGSDSDKLFESAPIGGDNKGKTIPFVIPNNKTSNMLDLIWE